jgi:arylsulfatase A
MRIFVCLLGLLACTYATEKPNIIFILADDLGIGDVRPFNSHSKIPTPSLTRMAAEGMKFTDAHTPSSVCTPTRYGLLTGRYNWRSRLQSGVLGGLSPRLIEPGRLTVAQFLKDQGYATACIGKWHLGLDWVKKPGREVNALGIEKPEQNDAVDYGQPFANGPTTLGFDHFFGISASLDMVPYTYLENDHVVAFPAIEASFPMMGDRPNGAKTRKGPAGEGFAAVDVLPKITTEAVNWIGARAKSDTRFFLYLPLAAPHTPTVPSSEWAGRSELNAYGDFVMQVDATVGAILEAVDKNKLSQNTLIVFTSDNGCSPMARIDELRSKGHDPCGGFRGTKADLWEGGHRVPFLVRWPGKVPGGRVSDAIVCLTDFFATCAEIVGQPLPESAGEDSVSFLSALRGEPGTRKTLVSHSIAGHFAIRRENLKLCLTPGSGGWSAPRPNAPAAANLPAVQLYDLAADRAETRNLATERPHDVKALTELLEGYVREGRSTPGPRQANTVEVQIRKGAR